MTDENPEIHSPNENIQALKPTGLRSLGETYVNAFVTFIDILGFKEIVNGVDPKKINKLLDAMKEFTASPQKRRPPYDNPEHLPIVAQFSDSIVRIQPLPNNDEDVDPLDLFHGEISSLTIAQGNLACNKILVRGGITFGPVCVHESRIFGPAFNRAYFIESKLAIHPRIIIDEVLLSSSTTNPLVKLPSRNNWESAKESILEFIRRSEDGHWITNYLPNIIESNAEFSSDEILIAHRNALRKLLSEAIKAKDESIRAKVRWAASYHNSLIKNNYVKINEKHEEKGGSLFVDLDGVEA